MLNMATLSLGQFLLDDDERDVRVPLWRLLLVPEGPHPRLGPADLPHGDAAAAEGISRLMLQH